MSRGGHTLLELLAVTAVVAILGVLVTSACWQVYSDASLAVSANNIRQLSAGANGYLLDHNQKFWPYRENVAGVGVRWWFGLESFASLSLPEGQRKYDATQGPLGGYIPAGIHPDPSFLLTERAFKPKYQSGYLGVGYNVLLADPNRMKGWTGTGQPIGYSTLKDPAKVVVFATSAQVNTFESPASTSKPMIEEFYGIDDQETTVHFRHGRYAMVAFADGSVGFLPMDPSTLDTRAPKAYVGRFAPVGDAKYLH